MHAIRKDLEQQNYEQKRKIGRPLYYDERMISVHLRMPAQMWEHAMRMGGSQWVRQLVENTYPSDSKP